MEEGFKVITLSPIYIFAISLLEKGVDIRVVQELLGHSSVKVTERYTHPNKARKYEAVNLI